MVGVFRHYLSTYNNNNNRPAKVTSEKQLKTLTE
jgi:hypothetical protein